MSAEGTEAAYYRLPVGLKGLVADQAKRNGRTANAEAVRLLKLGLDGTPVLPPGFGVMRPEHLLPGERGLARDSRTGLVTEVVGTPDGYVHRAV